MPTRFIKGILLMLGLAMLAACTSTPIQPSQATQAKPGAALALFESARRSLANDDLTGAETRLKELSETWPQYSSVYTNLGIVYARSGRPAQALAAFAHASGLAPQDCPPRVEAGILYREQRDFVAAERNYQACLAQHPDNEPALINLGILYEIYMGKWQDALAIYQHFQALQPEPDKRVAGWIADLSRRIEHTNTIAAGGKNQ